MAEAQSVKIDKRRLKGVMRPRHQEDVKAKIQSDHLIDFLQKHALSRNKRKFDPTRVKAAEILLARTMPVLSAVEQTIIDPRDNLTEDQILLEAKALIDASPGLLDTLIALRDASNISKPVTPSPAQPVIATSE